jgi:sarcosine oxidase gamma subunit
VENSADAAVLLDLTPGLYTAVVEAPAGVAPGPVLLEVYDAAAPRLTALQNLSTRTRVRAGETNAIGGLVVRGGLKKAVLIRIAGPALRTVGVQDVLPQPRAIVRRGAEVIVTVGPWSEAANAADIRKAAANVSAFAFAEGSADAAALVDLGPGAYTIEISGANATSGVALLEIYALPY